ncbi:MAG: hypothetical protein LAP13_15710, partial [Acidobacteriia bacterium]|nr:hypothetical protein [Terriglobia bacterium]
MSHTSAKSTVAIVTGDEALADELAEALRADFELRKATSYDQAYTLLESGELDVALLDLNTKNGTFREGLELLGQVQNSDLDTMVIVL